MDFIQAQKHRTVALTSDSSLVLSLPMVERALAMDLTLCRRFVVGEDESAFLCKVRVCVCVCVF